MLSYVLNHMSMKPSSMTGVNSSKAHDAASEAALETDFDKLKPLSVVRAKHGDTVPLVSVFQVTDSGTVTCSTSCGSMVLWHTSTLPVS